MSKTQFDKHVPVLISGVQWTGNNLQEVFDWCQKYCDDKRFDIKYCHLEKPSLYVAFGKQIQYSEYSSVHRGYWIVYTGNNDLATDATFRVLTDGTVKAFNWLKDD